MTPITLQSLTLAGVVLCVIAVLFSVLVIPTIAPQTFFVASCVLLGLAVWMHRAQFGTEQYERNTLKYTLRNAASGIVILMVILGIIGFFYFNKYNGPSIMGPAPPAISLPVVGGGLASVAKNAVSRVKEVMRTGKLTM
jgi:hypothetical protein